MYYRQSVLVVSFQGSSRVSSGLAALSLAKFGGLWFVRLWSLHSAVIAPWGAGIDSELSHEPPSTRVAMARNGGSSNSTTRHSQVR
jgi:hypothetical protein